MTTELISSFGANLKGFEIYLRTNLRYLPNNRYNLRGELWAHDRWMPGDRVTKGAHRDFIKEKRIPRLLRECRLRKWQCAAAIMHGLMLCGSYFARRALWTRGLEARVWYPVLFGWRSQKQQGDLAWENDANRCSNYCFSNFSESKRTRTPSLQSETLNEHISSNTKALAFQQQGRYLLIDEYDVY